MQGGVPHCLTLCLLPEKEQQKQRQKEGQFGLSQHGSCVHACTQPREYNIIYPYIQCKLQYVLFKSWLCCIFHLHKYIYDPRIEVRGVCSYNDMHCKGGSD